MIAPARPDKDKIVSFNQVMFPRVSDVLGRAQDEATFNHQTYRETQRSIGQAMQEYRMAAQIGLRELSRKCGISPGCLSKLENGGLRNWSAAIIKKYLDALALPPEDPKRFKRRRRRKKKKGTARGKRK